MRVTRSISARVYVIVLVPRSSGPDPLMPRGVP